MLTPILASLRLFSPASSTLPLPLPHTWLLHLPKEMLYHLLSFLPLPDCGQLCLASQPVKELLLDWVTSPACLVQLTSGLARLPPGSEARLKLWLAVCRQLGLFCKRATMLDSPGTRLATLTTCFSSLQKFGCSQLSSPWDEVTRMSGLADALHTISLGWDDKEYVGILHLLQEIFPVLQCLHGSPDYLFMEHGVEDEQKSKLRAVLRIFYWEFSKDQASQANRLSFLLRRFSSPTSLPDSFVTQDLQSKLLFFMLGNTEPVTWLAERSFQDSVMSRLYTRPDFSLLQEDQVIANTYSEAKHLFGDLGKALRVLHDHQDSSSSKVSVCKVTMALADGMDWDIDNLAACLLFSSEGVVGEFLRGLARERKVEQRLERIGKLLAAMLMVCDRLGNRLNQGLANILDFAFSGLIGSLAQRKKLIAVFWRELGERLEDDLGLDILVQMGLHIGNKAFRSKEVKVRQFNFQPEE